MKYRGSCLCGRVKFVVNKEIQTIYHCHCSLCRKQSGAGANAATLVKHSTFEWIGNIDCIATFRKDSGFTSCFCTNCGSPVPNKVGKSAFIWIPLGLLDESPIIQKRFGFCIHSKSNWAPLIQFDEAFSALPSWHELDNYFD